MSAYRGHTEGIPREKTSSQKYTVIALDFWIDEVFLVFQIWGQNIIGRQFLGHYHPRAVYPQILHAIPAEGNALILWFFYMQKINEKCPQISDEKKTSYAPLIKNFLIIILKNQKLFVKGAKTFFFIRNLKTFCIYFLQVLKIRIWGHLHSAGIACKIYLLMPSNFDEKNALWLWLILPSKNNGIYDN